MLEDALGMLTFFVTIMAVFIGGTAVIMAVIRRRMKRAGKITLGLMAWLGFYMAALLIVSFNSHERFISVGQERCFDEMCFSVHDVALTNKLGTKNVQGVVYAMTITLRNDARRTAQRPSQPEIFIIDAQGRHYSDMLYMDNLAEFAQGQPVTAMQLWVEKLQPGESISRRVAFHLPEVVEEPGLVINEGVGPLAVIIIGNEGSLFHARTVFVLPR